MPSVSAIVVSRDRAASLDRTIAALRLQRPVQPEIVVVSNGAPPEGVDRHVRFDDANVAAARNAGIAAAGGEVLAFCDDDAVPEPDWLDRLMPAFDDPAVAAAGGPVLRPDGIDIDWGETGFDMFGTDRPDGGYRKLHGANIAFRRNALARTGGFDTGFAYYLDETELLIRLHHAGWTIAWCQDAVMHHARLPNAVRGGATSPEGFRRLGQSKARFARLHATEDPGPDQALFRAAQWRRLMALHDLGRLDGAGVVARIAALEAGLRSPAEGEVSSVDPASGAAGWSAPARARIALAPRIAGRRAARRMAARLAREGHEVTLVILRYTDQPMRVRFENGHWLHMGGLFRERRCRGWQAQLRRELDRVADRRAFTHIAVGTLFGGFVVMRLSDGVPIRLRPGSVHELSGMCAMHH
ncbi:glycosyltransferase family 2 protein [Roseobacter sp. HKCCA0434]|uniref:glycosyltransferase family 2 protein n=1 Tax=Roseobacter sp. HKCCA0434 TaxID=3079297 RepID=UPI002905AAA8|nr:glycosyltransferase [Roseobacter sp. HKCCA0434]